MARRRKTRGYNESNDDEDDGGRKYDLKEKIRSERFDDHNDYLEEHDGNSVTLKLIQHHGFIKPMLIREPDGLHLKVPEKGFLVRDVRDCVGEDRLIDVMDVRTQKNIEMTMKDWCKYYESKKRVRLLNVISLEFSHTELDELVEAPLIVRLLDWVDLVWPKFLKQSQTESTNKIDKMKYPKVQKYCLMSVKGSYTDFHIDFGGTSVWYHILNGKKIFWMVPPTELNLQTFEEWTLSGMQQEVFFGDLVEECYRVELEANNTFFIPSGWIHAVYTLEDSLVFGGNFLHSFGIENQLKVSKIEDATKVPVKFRYPFYTEIQWYVIQHYVHCLTGKDHLHPLNKFANTTPEKTKLSIDPSSDAKLSKKRSKHNDDDETETESEKEESDTGEIKRKSNVSVKSAKSKKSVRPAKVVPSKRNNRKHSSDYEVDDSETEVETEVESDEGKTKEKPATCRMTKNSLMRLQYEVDQSAETHTKTSPNKQAAVGSVEKHGESTIQSPGESGKAPDKLLSPDRTNFNSWSASLPQTGGQGSWSNPDQQPKGSDKVHMTRYELSGLKLLVKHLSKLSGAKKHLPSLIRNSRSLLDDCKKMIAEHENDDPELAITGLPITVELLQPKGSDMNQLIGQFFKSSTNSTNEETPQARSKIDSTTLTNQQRNKFLGNIDLLDCIKMEDKTPSTIHENIASHKDSRFSNSAKKSFGSASAVPTPTSAGSQTNSATNSLAASSDSQPPRIKSPPTRPLSNSQYSSKTKNDSGLILPGSFADLIAATSTEKKAFDVSPADVASALFGSKNSQRLPHRPAGSASAQKIAQSSYDKSKITNLLKTKSSVDVKLEPDQDNHKDLQPPKPNSPEPPKMNPPKRFINPALKPPNKEKLIFASAPYVSPVRVQNSRPGNLYPWQSPAPHQAPQQTQQQPQLNQCQSLSPHKSSDVKTQDQGKSKTNPDNNDLRSVPMDKFKPISVDAPIGKSAIDTVVQKIPPHDSMKDVAPTSSNPNQYICDQSLGDTVKSPHIDSTINDSMNSLDSSAKLGLKSPNSQQLGSSDAQMIKETTLTLEPSSQVISASDDNEQKVTKPSKPRGPPKKSKEARQAVLLSPPRPIVAPTQRFILTQAPPRVPIVTEAQGTSAISTSPTDPTTQSSCNDKSKTKVKRAKKPKETDKKVALQSQGPIVTGLKLDPSSNQSIICGLMPSAINSQAGTSNKPQPTHQYLISRPLMFNTMPVISAAQLQRLPRAPMPIISATMPTPLSLANTQPGTRIVWATQPRQPNIASTLISEKNVPSNPGHVNPSVTSVSNSSPAAKKSGVSNTPSVSTNSRQPDNTALLSLATTALSTSPLPTTPTLSYLGGIRPPTTGQAIMVSSATGQPALLAGHPYFNPYMPRLPLASQYPTLGLGPPIPGLLPRATPRPMNLSGSGPRPTGQLVFARLPNQGQSRYLITQPYIQPRPQTSTSTSIASQQNPSLSFGTFSPNCPSDAAKVGMKTKKVKTR